jgi:hypothetical protein
MRPACLRSVPRRCGLLGLSLLLASPAPAAAQFGMDLSRPPRQERSVEVRSTLPPWVAVPLHARILSSDGLEFRALKNSAVTYENARLGVLVGALRNDGRCARQLTARLQYTDEHWRPVGPPLENEARVSQVEPGGVLPYRFRLRRIDEFDAAPSGYIVQITEADKPVAATLQWVSPGRIVDRSPCPPAALVASVQEKTRRATLSGYRVDGTLTVLRGGPVRPDGVVLTALLRDDAGEVLEVLTGIPEPSKARPAAPIENAQSVAFRLSTGIPLGKAVKTVEFFTEALPGAEIADPQPVRPE